MSKAVKTGILEDLEDTVLLIEGVSTDILSDSITNIIRGPLIGYTQQVCEEYGIPMDKEVSSGPVWNMTTSTWDVDYVELPARNGEKLILLPKSIVRINFEYNVGEYYRHYIIERLKEEEEEKNSSLVHVIKSGKDKGKKRVYKTELMAKYGKKEESVSIEQTQNFPELLKKYKQDHSAPTPALSHRQISDALNIAPPDWDGALARVKAIIPGKKAAYDYEDAILDLLNMLFYPVLVDPETQTPIHNGMKRVDITHTNYARTGFFEWVGRNYKCPYIFVECKNFGEELGNPEIDQIAMRFSENRGNFGIVVCRKVENKKRMLERCQVIAKENKGFVVVFDDGDLSALVEEAKVIFPQDYEFSHLREWFKKLVF